MKTVIENTGRKIKIGERRIRTKFLWLPKILPIKGKPHKVGRWLERSEILQEFSVRTRYEEHNPYHSKTEEYRGWNDIEWDDVDIIIQS